jgi:hypothetical protein
MRRAAVGIDGDSKEKYPEQGHGVESRRGEAMGAIGSPSLMRYELFA